LPADLFVWPCPRSYTGQDLVELHTFSSPPLVNLLIGKLLNAGSRPAQPGEFTMRAFFAGKLDLTQAEAVLGIIEARSRDELKEALAQLAGGLGRPLHDLRDDLLNLLAEVEAGLDFAEEDIQFVGRNDLLHGLAKGMARVTNLRRQLVQRTVERSAFRVVLVGRPNAGKSSLFNALAGAAPALVSPEPGTTRDYLVRSLKIDDVVIELVDTAGWQPANGMIDAQAQRMGHEQAEHADLILLCLEADRPVAEQERILLAQREPPALGIATKCDLALASSELIATSAVTRHGLEALRSVLIERARTRLQRGLTPSFSRCGHHLDSVLEHLRRAHAIVLYKDLPEVLAVELRGAIDQLGEMVGAVYTDDLLDRIFSRFCIGK
jgi:tRNA modification GTPase